MLRSIKDAQSCLRQTAYKQVLEETFDAQAMEVKSALEPNQKDPLRLPRSKKPLQFAVYVLTKHLGKLLEEADNLNYESAMDRLVAVETGLVTSLSRLSNNAKLTP